jgi:hypothetical protein
MRSRPFTPDLITIFIKGMDEVFPINNILQVSSTEANLQESLGLIENLILETEKQFGSKSASGLFFRCGCAAFKHFVRNFGKQIDIDSLAFRLQPQQKRLMDGVQKLVQRLESWQAGEFSILKKEDLVEISAFAAGVTSPEFGERIWLHFVAGLIQEYIYWAGGGKQYPFQIIAIDQPGNGIIIQFRIVPVD